MMKLLAICAALAVLVVANDEPQTSSANDVFKFDKTCTSLKDDTEAKENAWIDIPCECTKIMRLQIKKEIEASFTYLQLGAYFARDQVNLPGFSNFFFSAASEEREHSHKLIEYLLMRGREVAYAGVNFDNLITEVVDVVGMDGEKALRAALLKEISVTEHIRKVIKVCETDKNYNDYHLVDYLTGEFLDEQHKGQRDIAEKIETLHKMKKTHASLGEFLFDKTL